VASCYVASCDVASCYVVSCYVASCVVVSCDVASCYVANCKGTILNTQPLWEGSYQGLNISLATPDVIRKKKILT
jgi:hypothetical protein